MNAAEYFIVLSDRPRVDRLLSRDCVRRGGNYPETGGSPVIFARYQKQTGQRSEHYLAILKHERTADFIRELPRDGGVVELENWQRARMTMNTDKGNSNVEITFDGETKTFAVEDAVKLMDELVLRGSEAAKKAW